jgi:hypothetical protein
MKSYTSVILFIFCIGVIREAVALRKVTVDVTVTGLTATQLESKAEKIVEALETLLNVKSGTVKLEGSPQPVVATTTAAAVATTTAAAVSAAPTTTPSRRLLYNGRRLQALVLTFSVEVANEAEANKMIAKIATVQADFTTKLQQIFPDATITADVGSATSSEVTPTTTPAAKGDVSGTTVTVASSILLSQLLVLLSLFMLQ